MSTELVLDDRTLEKITLAKQLGQVLRASDINRFDASAEEAAVLLAADPSPRVREALARGLSPCAWIPTGLIESLATDEEPVARTFLSVTQALAEADWLELIPKLNDNNLSHVACRPDVTDAVQRLVARTGGERSVTILVRNDAIQMCDGAFDLVMSRFGGDVGIMDQLSARSDLSPDKVKRLLDKVSNGAQQSLMSHYSVTLAPVQTQESSSDAVWAEIEGACAEDTEQVIIRLDQRGELTDELIVSIGEMGGVVFFEIALSHRAALPVQRVREMLSIKGHTQVVRLIKMARVAHSFGPRFLGVAKRYFSMPETPTGGEERSTGEAFLSSAGTMY